MPRVDEHEPSGSTPSRHEHHYRIDHPHLIDADEDRWRWRAKIRRNPTQLFFYRIGVAVLGLLLMVAAALTGPLPGPGGIPLFLLGLAVWASEFEWAQDLMLWFKAQFHRYQGWRWPRRLLFWLCFSACCGLAMYATMLVFGLPPWMPRFAKEWLQLLPGL